MTQLEAIQLLLGTGRVFTMAQLIDAVRALTGRKPQVKSLRKCISDLRRLADWQISMRRVGTTTFYQKH